MVNNEWDTLQRVIVGSATGAKIPHMDRSLRAVNYADRYDVRDVKIGDYPDQVIEEANEDLEIFVDFLVKQGVEVLRPDDIDPVYYNYCPRDSVIAYRDQCIATPMPLRARDREWWAVESHLTNVVDLTADHPDSLYDLDCIGNPDILALTEITPAFDAANVLRANDDLLYLVSNSGNLRGSQLLQETIGSRGRVRVVKDIYSYMHIDSTVAFLREGLMLLNPSRIQNRDQLPEPFNRWDVVWAPEPVDIGHYPGYCNSSKWVSVNLFSVSPNLVVVEERQTALRRELEKHGIDCAMLPMRHARTLGGCFHCVTLDLERSQ